MIILLIIIYYINIFFSLRNWYYFARNSADIALSISNETLTLSLESYGPLEDCLKRPENRMQNAHTISRDCNRAQRSLETAKRTLVDHAAESANDKRHSSPLFLPVAILTSLYALNRTPNDAHRLSLLRLYYVTYCFELRSKN